MIQDQLDALNADIKSSYCSHDEVEYEFDYEDGYPYTVGAQCVLCGKDITDQLSEAEVHTASEEEAERIVTDAIDLAVDYQRELDAGII